MAPDKFFFVCKLTVAVALPSASTIKLSTVRMSVRGEIESNLRFVGLLGVAKALATVATKKTTTNTMFFISCLLFILVFLT